MSGAVIGTGALMLARSLAVLVLMVGPGAWFSGRAASQRRTRWTAIWLSAALSPIVLIAEFYALRLARIPFDLTAFFLVALNLPPLVRLLGGVPLPRASDAARLFHGTLVLIVPFAMLAPQLLDPAGRALSGHAWMHGDVTYLIANGQLAVEDPNLAGMRLAYAWAGHAYQAVLSRILDVTPVSSYIATNVLSLAVTIALVWQTVALLGGGWAARLASVGLLCFGVNFAGYTLWQLLRYDGVMNAFGRFGGGLFEALRWGGDWRFTPWLLYFYFFHQIVIALGQFAALALLVVERRAEPWSLTDLVAGGLLATGIVVIYPVLFPAVAALLGAAALGVMAGRNASRESLRRAVPMVAILIVSAIATAACLAFTTRDRVAGFGGFKSPGQIVKETIVGVVVVSPLLAGLLATGWRKLRSEAGAVVTLAGAGIASLAMFAALNLPGGNNEYKFMFTTAVSLTPLAALGAGRMLDRLGRAAGAGAVALTLVLALPFAHKLARDGWARRWIPALTDTEPFASALDLSGFDLRLVDGAPLAPLVDAVREETPETSMVVARATPLHLPTLTQRPLYVALPEQAGAYRGLNIRVDELLSDVRGYDPAIIADRRATVEELFGTVDTVRAAALARIQRFGRPVVIITAEQDSALARWLGGTARGRRITDVGEPTAWLVPGTAAAERRGERRTP